MQYPQMKQLDQLLRAFKLYTQLKVEYGSTGTSSIINNVEKAMHTALAEVKALPNDPDMAQQEPNELDAIKCLRSNGSRRIWQQFNQSVYLDRLEGALLGRFAGCTLGAPVEGWPIARMQALAEENSQPFPPTDYWSYVPDPAQLRYDLSPRSGYTLGGINGVPVDDDIAYTLLGLLVVEDFGSNFTIAQNGKAWL